MILPGQILGIIGGGQLGMFFIQAAHRLGYKVCLLEPNTKAPAARYADYHIAKDYTDNNALEEMLAQSAAITLEFEHVPQQLLDFFKKNQKLQPYAEIIAIFQHRGLEKTWLQQQGIPTVPFAIINTLEDIEKIPNTFQYPLRLKRSIAGYDGKGQALCDSKNTIIETFNSWQQPCCVIEQQINLDKEISIILAANQKDYIFYPIAENIHQEGILDTSIVPADITENITNQAQNIAKTIIKASNYQGIMAIEFFITQDQQILVNEIAPRPHNSGHYTLDACICSQFEQQVRTLCNLPLGKTSLICTTATMHNIIGLEPVKAFLDNNAKLYWYGKEVAREKRKMGHYTLLK